MIEHGKDRYFDRLVRYSHSGEMFVARYDAYNDNYWLNGQYLDLYEGYEVIENLPELLAELSNEIRGIKRSLDQE